MKSLCGTLQECWDSDPEARLTAECVQFRITELLSEPTGMTSHSTEMTSRPTGMTSHPTEMTSHPTEMTSHSTEMTYLQIVWRNQEKTEDLGKHKILLLGEWSIFYLGITFTFTEKPMKSSNSCKSIFIEQKLIDCLGLECYYSIFQWFRVCLFRKSL